MPNAQIEVVLPLPPEQLWPNYRKHRHWGPRAQATKKARADAKYATIDAVNRQKPIGLPWKYASMRAVFYFRSSRNKRDPGNCLRALKAYEDGLQDGGLIANDYFLCPLPPSRQVDRDHPRVVLTIERAESWGEPGRFGRNPAAAIVPVGKEPRVCPRCRHLAYLAAEGLCCACVLRQLQAERSAPGGPERESPPR